MALARAIYHNHSILVMDEFTSALDTKTEDKIISNTKFTFTPAQHWSARGLRDRNKSLWGSWFI